MGGGSGMVPALGGPTCRTCSSEAARVAALSSALSRRGLCSGAFPAWQPLTNQNSRPGGQAFLGATCESARAALARPQGTYPEPHPFPGCSGREPSASWTLAKDKILGIFRKALWKSIFTFLVTPLKSCDQGPETTSEALLAW